MSTVSHLSTMADPFLCVKKDAVHDVEGKTWGREQRIEYTDAGAVLSFEGTQYNEVLRWVLSFGSEAVPIAPQRLAEEWRRLQGQECYYPCLSKFI